MLPTTIDYQFLKDKSDSSPVQKLTINFKRQVPDERPGISLKQVRCSCDHEPVTFVKFP
mgnify:CR=1 FL=1|jgi:hypothetical protein